MTSTWQPRPDRPEGGPFVDSDLAREIERLKTEAAWRDGHEVGPGQVVTMETGLPQAGEAREDTAFLLILVEEAPR